MAKFDFELVYKLGTTNKADHLSCCPNYDDSSLDNQDITVLPPHLFIHASTISNLEQLILDAQLVNPNLLHQWASCFNLIESNSTWYHSSALVVMEDNDLRREVLSLCMITIWWDTQGFQKLWASSCKTIGGQQSKNS
jgi:hypothetical protein